MNDLDRIIERLDLLLKAVKEVRETLEGQGERLDKMESDLKWLQNQTGGINP